MLLLTDNATTVIRSIVDRPELPESAGLRIASTSDGSHPLAVSAASEPQEGDEIVEDKGARVFLEPNAATMLDDKVLDATVDEAGAVEFLLAVQ